MRDGETLFEQNVDSIQVEHEKKDSANKGEVVGSLQNQLNGWMHRILQKGHLN